MKKTKAMLKASLLCVLLWFMLPTSAQGQYYETTYAGQYSQQGEQTQKEGEEKGSGLPWWAWVLIAWAGLAGIGWIMDDDDDDESQPTRPQNRQTEVRPPRRSGYVVDPSRR